MLQRRWSRSNQGNLAWITTQTCCYINIAVKTTTRLCCDWNERLILQFCSLFVSWIQGEMPIRCGLGFYKPSKKIFFPINWNQFCSSSFSTMTSCRVLTCHLDSKLMEVKVMSLRVRKGAQWSRHVCAVTQIKRHACAVQESKNRVPTQLSVQNSLKKKYFSY